LLELLEPVCESKEEAEDGQWQSQEEVAVQQTRDSVAEKDEEAKQQRN
jgi:hypothetical protein